MNKVIIKLDDARDMIMDLNHDQAVKVLPFLQWHINSMQNLKDSGFQIGDRVKGVNTAWKGNGTIIDITHDRVRVDRDDSHLDGRIKPRTFSARFLTKI
jgi:hypothetical protein|tara:strand:+ start:191 stop:487 length:297 start_codon:yes stop_codon:yes gene_type:complete